MPDPATLDMIESVVMARQGNRIGEEVRFRCPAEGHVDEHPSARWNAHKATWFCDACKAGGGATDLATRLGIGRPVKSRSPGEAPGARRIVAAYDYTRDGELLFQVVRFEPKSFAQRVPDGGKSWVWGLKGTEPVLYRLDDLRAADPADWVYLPAGEKDVDRLRRLGSVATTNPMGEGKWRQGYTEELAGRKVAIIQDNDAVGHGHAATVASHLRAVGCTVKVLDLPGLPEKGDVSDWLDSGHTVTDLDGFREGVPVWEPTASTFDIVVGKSDNEAPIRLLTRRASTIMPKAIDWVWKGWLAAGMLHVFAGYGGSGKSTIALALAAACSVGGKLPDGQPAPLLNTLYFAAEDSPEHTIVPRLISLGADLKRIHIVDGILREGDEPGWIQLRNHIALIEETVIEHNIGLVLIDPISSYIGDANGDKESDVRAGIMPLVRMAERTGVAVLAIRHVSKGGDSTRAASRILGSTAWHDVPRVAWMLADAPDDDQPEPNEDGTRDTKRVLGVVKSNIAAKPQARWGIQPANGPFRWLPDPSPVTVDECFTSAVDRGSKSRDAEEWLKERLASGSQPTTAVEAAARAAKISPASLKRARAALNVKARKESTGEWVLSLPPRLSVVNSEGALASQGGEDVNSFHNDVETKGLTMNPLSPFPDQRGYPATNGDAEQPSVVGQGGKGLKTALYAPLEPLRIGQATGTHDDEGEVF